MKLEGDWSVVWVFDYESALMCTLWVGSVVNSGIFRGAGEGSGDWWGEEVVERST